MSQWLPHLLPLPVDLDPAGAAPTAGSLLHRAEPPHWRARTGLLPWTAALRALGLVGAALLAGCALHPALKHSHDMEIPDSVIARQKLAASLHQLGAEALAQGRLDEAHALFQRAFELRQALADAEPSHVMRLYELSVSLDRLATVTQAQGRLHEARALFQRLVSLGQALHEAEPSNVSFQRELATSLVLLGDVSYDLGRIDEARSLFQRSLELRKPLLAADPTHALLQREVASSHERLGSIALEQERYGDARAAYQQNLEILQALAAAAPESVESQLDWVAGEIRMALACLATQDSQAYQRHRARAWQALASLMQRPQGDNPPRALTLRDRLSRLPP